MQFKTYCKRKIHKMQKFFIPMLFGIILNCPDEHLFKRNRLYRKLCNSSKLSDSSLPAYSIIYIYICMYVCIRWYVTLADITLRLPASDRPATGQRMMAKACPDRARPCPYRTALYGAQSQRRSFARNPAYTHTRTLRLRH